MILYKALYTYDSEESCDLYFEKNDVIECVSQPSSLWYKGINLMTGKSGLFPYNFVTKIDISEEEENVYIIKESFNNCLKGDIIIGTSVRDSDIIGYVITDPNQRSINIPLKYLQTIKEKPFNFKFIKCIANTDSNSDLDQLPFLIGDIIWMTKKVDNDFGEGYINGKKGMFSLLKVDIEEEEETNLSIDRENKWVALFDYNSDNKNDLQLVHSEKLKFLDWIDNNWVLMQNEDGQVGMVPCNFVRNISIKGSPQNKKFEVNMNISMEEVRVNMHLKPITNELDNHKPRRFGSNDNKEDYSIQENKCNTLQSIYFDIDENVFDENNELIQDHPMDGKSDEISESIELEFEKREKKVENDMEILMKDIVSIKNDIACEDSDQNYIYMMSNNLSFLKEEYKERQKQLIFIKEQKGNFLNGNAIDIDESDYCLLLDNEEMDKKLFTRRKTIEEILETEFKFINDMKLTLKVFNLSNMVNKISLQDYNTLFGDLEGIILLSESFYCNLLKDINTFGIEASIGSLFLKFLPSFESIYKEYCVIYDKKLELINKKQRSQEIEDFIKEGLKKINDEGNQIICIDAMLVKPLQRFLKYPLFMKTIIQNTSDGHIDITDLQTALIQFETIAKKINEKKRFAELRTEIFQRNGQWHQKTLHALQKVPKRLLVASLFGSQYDDDLEYRDAVTMFKKLNKFVSLFIETIVILRDNFKDILAIYYEINEDLTEIISSTYGSLLYQYIIICKNAESIYYKKYISALESLVINPLTKLLELFSGPKILIKKRKSKFLDYIGANQKIDKEITRAQSDRLEGIKNQYLAINNTLKEELPILTSKATVIFNECLTNYLHLNSSTIQISIDSLHSLIVDVQETLEEEQRICRNKQMEILNRLQRNMLTYYSRNDVHRVELSPTNPRRCRSDSVSRTEYYCQTDEDIMNLKIKFEPRNLAYVKKDFIPTKTHQIYVSHGNMVGIIKRCDPQGHTSSWLVEVCLKRVGFVPRSYLNDVPLSKDRQHSLVVKPSVTNSISFSREQRYSMLECSSNLDMMQFSPNSPNNKSMSICDSPYEEIRIALFDFRSTGQTDISMIKADQLQLIESHDKSGNTCWSLVKNLRTGAQGYVPTNYMSNEL